MDRLVKQRVVGAAILVVLGVVFIPIFLDDGGLERSVPGVTELPPLPSDDFSSRVLPLDEPDIAALEDRLDEPPAAMPPTPPPPEPSPAPDETPAPAATAATDPPAPADTGEPDSSYTNVVAALPSPRDSLAAWTVQLGSFENDANAKRLIDKLRADGFPAYLERQVDGEVTMFKVRVGPQIRRDEAEQVRRRLEEQFALKGMLLRYR